MRIGVLGGTFDPIHVGHLYLARKVLKKLSLAKIIFIPAYLPPHKKNIKVTTARHRCNMVKLAIANRKKLKVSDIEIKRKGRSYSVRTLQQLKKKYGRSVELFFIAGSDSLDELDKWKDLKEILRLCKFVIVKRPGCAIKKVPRQFMILRINAKDISSSDIRKRIKKGQPVKRLVPAKVRRYIDRHLLYQGSTLTIS